MQSIPANKVYAPQAPQPPNSYNMNILLDLVEVLTQFEATMLVQDEKCVYASHAVPLHHRPEVPLWHHVLHPKEFTWTPHGLIWILADILDFVPSVNQWRSSNLQSYPLESREYVRNPQYSCIPMQLTNNHHRLQRRWRLQHGPSISRRTQQSRQ